MYIISTGQKIKNKKKKKIVKKNYCLITLKIYLVYLTKSLMLI